ncbi:hypothetical protein [Rhodococcus rhodochrous]|uniref:hypothetical protein n=1 Tax=Rhodococcus rhodochrous TaxID=1829 RepID=UPI0017817598|nr:hypothetical protein [Rhodococcus rhodochrous]
MSEPAKSEDELQEKLIASMVDAFHIDDCDGVIVEVKDVKAYVWHKLFPLIKQEAESHADAVIGEYERTLKARPPFVRNALRAEQRKRNVYPIKDPK